MATVNEGWQERFQEITQWVEEHPSDVWYAARDLYRSGIISKEEGERSTWKINLIEPFVRRMVLNMIKGTIKYPSDDWTADVWQDMGLDDKADSINYELLFHNYLRKQGVKGVI